MQAKVLIIVQDSSITQMFSMNGWLVTNNTLDPDIQLVQFTGGEDVSPHLYNEKLHPATRANPLRDAREADLFLEFKGKIPMAGICRGAQFLNVMSGGSLWQHVTGHGIRDTHPAFDVMSEKTIRVTSTHHQMMIPSNEAIVLLTASISDVKQGFERQELGGLKDDIEALYYPTTSCLCYQPHPEYVDIDHDCQTTYFEYLKTFFDL